MNENLELIMHMFTASDMGVYTTTNLINLLNKKENKIKHLLETELKEYEKFLSISEDILKRNDVEPKSSGMMAKLGSDISMTMDTMKDNSDSAVAGILIQGFTMGVIEIETKMKRYKSVCDKRYLKIANDFLKFHKTEIEKLKLFL